MRAFIVIVSAALVAVPLAASGEYQISPAVVGSGGGLSTGVGYRTLGTLGQAAIGVVSGPSYMSQIGFWYQPGWITTGVEEPGDLFPIVFSLAQNQPNPFNPVTTIRFGVPKQSRVAIRLYNVAGREVRTLADGEMDPGYHTVTLDGEGLASGIYFCRMEAPGFEDTRKLILLK
jgi:hypothetical protein